MDSICCCFQENGSPGNSDNDDDQNAQWKQISMAIEQGNLNNNVYQNHNNTKIPIPISVSIQFYYNIIIWQPCSFMTNLIFHVQEQQSVDIETKKKKQICP